MVPVVMVVSYLELPKSWGKHVIGVNCLNNESRIAEVDVNDQKQIWKKHMARSMNSENKWGTTLLQVR